MPYQETSKQKQKRLAAAQKFHDKTRKEWEEKHPLPFCACGCGNLTSYRPKSHVINKFIWGHSRKGTKQSKQTIEKRSVSLKKAYKEGKMSHVRNYSADKYEKIAKKTRGQTRSEKATQATKIGVLNAWSGNGKYRRNRWTLVSPTGIRYITTNLLRWCRENQHLFTEYAPKSKTTLWQRSARGISRLAHEKHCCSHHGWTLAQCVPLKPLKGTPGPDLLGRDEAAMLL